MDKKLVGAFAITLTALVLTVGLSRCDFSQLAQIFVPSPTQTPSPTPTPTPTSSPTTTPSPTRTPTGQFNIPKPSVPEFTVEFVNETVKVSIKNQPFEDYYDPGRHKPLKFYYNIYVKLHSSDEWIALYDLNYGIGLLDQSSQSEYTEVYYSSDKWGSTEVYYPSGCQVDFRVKAIIGFVDAYGVLPYGCFYYFEDTKTSWSEIQTITIP